MPILSTIGRRHWRVRVLLATIYIVLTVGAAAMVYPFLLMMAGSTKSAVDGTEWRLVPGFLTDRTALYRKYLEGLFNESLVMMNAAYGTAWPSFQAAEFRPPNAAWAAEWKAFIESPECPPYSYSVGFLATPVSWKVTPEYLRAFKAEARTEFQDEIHRLNRVWNTEFSDWNTFYVDPGDYILRRVRPGAGALDTALTAFKARQPAGVRYYFSAEGYFKTAFLMPYYGRDLAAYNRVHGTQWISWDQVHLSSSLPEGEKERSEWNEFTGGILNLLWLCPEPAAAPPYRDFLRAKYGGIEAVNRLYRTHYADLDAVPLVEGIPEQSMVLSDWETFVQGWHDPVQGRAYRLPPEWIRICSVDFLFREHLRRHYATVEKLNARFGTTFASWEDVLPPQRDLHGLFFLDNVSKLRREFVALNYRTVADYLLVHGRAMRNTLIYCGLAVLCALIFNPMAAYALSRFRPPFTHSVLLFLMMTMAFPPMVAQIPVFLMMREFGLLNTFWALILPGLASGYSIFLLKGFFDSQPRELYESASLDGAGEVRIFWIIAMGLSKPILAVIALHAFTAAYANFMMALLICQDQSMWTLMPWLFQLQQRCNVGVVYASLLVAAIPSVLAFLLCQRYILRGIVVPVEK